jgi:hypothetical protein
MQSGIYTIQRGQLTGVVAMQRMRSATTGLLLVMRVCDQLFIRIYNKLVALAICYVVRRSAPVLFLDSIFE